MTQEGKKTDLPIYKVKVGTIDGAIFENKGNDDDKVFHSIKITKNYKDKGGEWAKTQYLNVNDVPSAIIVLQKCYEHIKVSVDEVLKKE